MSIEIKRVFKEHSVTALAVARCESGLLMIQSHHQLSYGRERSFGIFQIHEPDWDATAKSLGLDAYQTNVRQNIQMAHHIFTQGGNSFMPWTCYWHKDHLAMNI